MELSSHSFSERLGLHMCGRGLVPGVWCRSVHRFRCDLGQFFCLKSHLSQTPDTHRTLLQSNLELCCSAHMPTRNMPIGGESGVTEREVHLSAVSLSLSSHSVEEGQDLVVLFNCSGKKKVRSLGWMCCVTELCNWTG